MAVGWRGRAILEVERTEGVASAGIRKARRKAGAACIQRLDVAETGNPSWKVGGRQEERGGDI